MNILKIIFVVTFLLVGVGCKDFIMRMVIDDPIPPVNAPEPTCSLEGEIISYTSIECMCCPGFEISFGNQTIFVSTLGDHVIEMEVLQKVHNDELPVKIRFDYGGVDTLCPSHQVLTCIELR
jgi:hypothetical protein